MRGPTAFAALAALVVGACSHGYEPVSEEEARELERVAATATDSHAAGMRVETGEGALRGAVPRPSSSPVQAGAPTPSASGFAVPAGAAAAPEAPSFATAGGLRWEAGPPLLARPPSSSMRAAEYFVAGEGGTGTAELTVFHFQGMGGGVEENVSRWLGQMRKPDGSPGPVDARRERIEVAGMVVHRVEARGTFTGGGPRMGGGVPVPDALLIGAIAEGPSGPVFFKLVGPAATVERARQAFDHLIGSLTPAR
jgi:hypothetical protein